MQITNSFPRTLNPSLVITTVNNLLVSLIRNSGTVDLVVRNSDVSGFETNFACFLPSSTVEYAVVTADFNPDKLRIFEKDFFIT